MDRRTLLVAALASSLFTAAAEAQNYPTGPITLVNPYAAGGPADLIVRTLGAAMSEQLGQQIVILNKPGGATAIAASSVAQAQPDGYTLLLSNASSHIVTPAMTKVTYDGMRDFTFIAMIASVPNVLVVRESLPLKTVPELIAYAKANPGKLNYASVGPGSQPHIAGEMFKQMTGTDITHVPYKGAAPAAVDLVAGQMDMGFLNIPPMLPHIASGKLHGLAVTSVKRAGQLPNVPSLDELGLKGFEVVTWYGIAAPAKLPQPIVDKLATAIEKSLKSETVRTKLAEQGVQVDWQSPQEFVEYLKVDSDRLTKLIKSANIKAD